jgi:hypothetical protein
VSRKRSPSVVAELTLTSLGHSVVALSLEQTQSMRDAWRRVYARPLKRDLGVWIRAGFDWHVFSYEHTYALERDAATTAYRAENCKELIVFSNDERDLGCRVRLASPPPLDDEQDVYISPPDFSWTMVFTHEKNWFGPYFSRAIWVDKPPAKPTPAPTKRQRSRNGSRR